MKPTHSLSVLVLTAAIAACSTIMPSDNSGFLSSYSDLKPGPDPASRVVRASIAIDRSKYLVRDVEWRVSGVVDISSEERSGLLKALKQGLEYPGQSPSAATGRQVIVRAAITRVETVSPTLNTLATLALIGPLDRGGAAVEIEAVDADTGRQLAALSLGYFVPLSEFRARFSKLAPAEIAVKKAANDFLALL